MKNSHRRDKPYFENRQEWNMLYAVLCLCAYWGRQAAAAHMLQHADAHIYSMICVDVDVDVSQDKTTNKSLYIHGEQCYIRCTSKRSRSGIWNERHSQVLLPNFTDFFGCCAQFIFPSET